MALPLSMMFGMRLSRHRSKATAQVQSDCTGPKRQAPVYSDGSAGSMALLLSTQMSTMFGIKLSWHSATQSDGSAGGMILLLSTLLSMMFSWCRTVARLGRTDGLPRQHA